MLTRPDTASDDKTALWRLVHRAEQAVEAVWAELGLGLTLRQVDVLAAVASAPASSQTELVAATGIDRSTLADISRRLTQRKLIRRRRTARDLRAYNVQLTAAGAALLEQAERAADSMMRKLAQPLSRREERELARLLGKLIGTRERG